MVLPIGAMLHGRLEDVSLTMGVRTAVLTPREDAIPEGRRGQAHFLKHLVFGTSLAPIRIRIVATPVLATVTLVAVMMSDVPDFRPAFRLDDPSEVLR